MAETNIANLAVKLTLDISDFTSGLSSVDASSIQKSVQSAIDDIDLDIKHFSLASEADELGAWEDQLSLIQGIQDKAADFGEELLKKGIESVTVAKNIETAWVGVTKTVTDIPEGVDPDKFFGDLKAEVYQMSTKMPRTFQEIAAAMSAAGQIGVNPELLGDYTEAMLQFESATNGAIKASEATTIFGQFLNTTGSAQESIANLASSVVALGNNTATDEKHILAMASAISGAGSSAGLTDAQIMGWSAALNSVGLNSGRAGTAFSEMVRELNIAVSTGNDKLGIFAETAGMSAEQFKTAWEQDASSALLKFFEGMGEASEENGAALYQTLKDLKIEQSQAKAIAEQLSGATDTVSKALTISEDAYSENAALANEAAEANGTLDAQMQMFQNSITAIQGQLGESLLPILEKLADALLPIFQEATKFISDHPGLAATIMGVAAAFEVLCVAAQFASIAMALGSVGLAPWLGAVAVIGAVVGVVVLLAEAFQNSHEMAAATLEDIENMNPAIDNLTEIAGTMYIEPKFVNTESAIDVFGEEFSEGTWVQFVNDFESPTGAAGWVRATEEEVAALNARLEETTAVTDAAAESLSLGFAGGELTETAENAGEAVTDTNDIMSRLNEQMSTISQTTEQFGTTMDEQLITSMDQLNSLIESDSFQQFANEPVDPSVQESWDSFGSSVSKTSDGFGDLKGMLEGLEEAGTNGFSDMFTPIDSSVTESWDLFSASVTKAGDGFGKIKGLLDALIEVGMTGFGDMFTPIDDETVTSYKNLAAAIREIYSALSGETLGEGEETEGTENTVPDGSKKNAGPLDLNKTPTDSPAGGEMTPTEGGSSGLADSFTQLSAKFDEILQKAQTLAAYFTGEFLTAVTTLQNALCIATTDEEGNTDASGGNTLYNSLGSIFGVLGDIYALSMRLASFWGTSFIGIISLLKEGLGPLQGKIASVGVTAAMAAEQFNLWAEAIWAVIGALQVLNGMGAGTGGGGGTGVGGARASGGPVDRDTTYLVGEEGPELFTPRRSGYIIPNEDLKGGRDERPEINVEINGNIYGDAYLKDYVVRTLTGTIRKELKLAA